MSEPTLMEQLQVRLLAKRKAQAAQSVGVQQGIEETPAQREARLMKDESAWSPYGANKSILPPCGGSLLR